MSVELVAVTFDVQDPATEAGFWADLLGRDVVQKGSGFLLPGTDTQVGLRFAAATSEKRDVNRLHLHLTSTSSEDQQRTIEKVLALDGRHLDVGQRPDEGHVVLGAPGGDAFCVIEPGNSYLEGCGRLGEVACDGTREAGLFWHEALGWPLVWEQDEETAIQSPLGGTKVSWGGSPLPEKTQRNRQRFSLAATDFPDDIARLVALGATEIESRPGEAELADPDGNEFCVTARGV